MALTGGAASGPGPAGTEPTGALALFAHLTAAIEDIRDWAKTAPLDDAQRDELLALTARAYATAELFDASVPLTGAPTTTQQGSAHRLRDHHRALLAAAAALAAVIDDAGTTSGT